MACYEAVWVSLMFLGWLVWIWPRAAGFALFLISLLALAGNAPAWFVRACAP